MSVNRGSSSEGKNVVKRAQKDISNNSSPFFLNGSFVPIDASLVTPIMAYYCFDSLISKLKNSAPTMNVAFTSVEHPLFVAWSKKDGDHEVRGCSGTFNATKIQEGLNKHSINAALHDARCQPITLKEVEELQVSVSILYNFEDGIHYLNWTPGKHGLQAHFKGRDYQMTTSTFLPMVPVEAGWSKVETIDNLMRKGGYIGKIGGEERESLQLSRYKCQTVTKTYEDYTQYRSWKSKN